MRNSPENKPSSKATDSTQLDQLFEAEHHPTHSQKWARLPEGIAADALIKAARLRAAEADPGDAYLQATADAYYRQTREKLIGEVLNDFDPTTELATLSPLDS